MKKISKFSQYVGVFLAVITFLSLSTLTVKAADPVCVSATSAVPGFATDFDTLVNTGTSSTTPPGTGFVEAPASANQLYTAGTGSSATGDTYSFGSAGSTERALGGLQSGTLIPTTGACIVNNTGGTLNSITIRYDGEQWRLGTAGRTDQLDFQYSTDATSLTTGTWTDFNALDFVSPNTTTIGALDGNLAANRTAAITSTINGLAIPVGATFYVRFLDFNAAGADDGLAIDNFYIFGAPNAAANSQVGGQVLNASGRGIGKVQVRISGGELTKPIYAMTSPFGYFNFEVPSGQTYVVTVISKAYTFSNSSQVVSVNDNVTNLNFTAKQQ